MSETPQSGDDARARLAGFPGATVGAGLPLSVQVPVASWVALAECCRDELGCTVFGFLTAVDWKDAGLEVVAWIDRADPPLPIVLRTRLAAGETVCPSLVGVYRGADWMERECFDMFGIQFAGHPDLRRILLPDDWSGHPLLKSYDVDTPHPPYR